MRYSIPVAVAVLLLASGPAAAFGGGFELPTLT